MKPSPLVSVVIPAYQADRFIDSAVDSILRQTIDDVEVIVVDDGSTDDTAAVVAAIEDERVTYCFQENAGQASARNTGLAKARGEFVAFLDADDRWLPDKLARQLKVFEDPAVGMVCCGYHSVDVAGRRIGKGCDGPRSDACELQSLLRQNRIGCSTIIVRRSVLEDNQLRFRDGRQGVEDWDLWLRVAMVCVIRSLPEKLVEYREHDGNCSGDFDKMAAGARQTVFDIRNEIRNRYADDTEMRRRYLQAAGDGLRDAHLRYGHQLLALGKPVDARGLFCQAIRQQPFAVRCWWGLVKSFLVGGKRDEPVD